MHKYFIIVEITNRVKDETFLKKKEEIQKELSKNISLLTNQNQRVKTITFVSKSSRL